jgi:hypothetical protein
MSVISGPGPSAIGCARHTSSINALISPSPLATIVKGYGPAFQVVIHRLRTGRMLVMFRAASIQNSVPPRHGLRIKLGDPWPSSPYIETIPGRGYRWRVHRDGPGLESRPAHTEGERVGQAGASIVTRGAYFLAG